MTQQPNAPKPGDTSAVFDPDALVSEIDRLLASDAGGNEEAALLEQAHQMINDALEGR
ncbi:MAG: hypothetical protein ACTH1D_11980 [Mycobacteriaceae bacterium]|uniref:hypothetical protein n=1 Tax=Corynebacterium sp. TaxID=1720 RepID=UPI003F9A07B0